MIYINDENIYINLISYCRWDEPEEVKSILEHTEGVIDVFYDSNILFKFAIKKESPEILESLIEYYKNKVVNRLNQDRQGAAIEKLTHAIEEAVDSTSSISAKVQEVVSKYSSHTDGEDYINDLDDIELVYDDHPVTTDTQQSTALLTEDNLVMLGGDLPNNNDTPL